MNDILNKIKICFIVGTLSQGGAERQLFYMLRTLREQGNTPSVLCLTQGEFWESHIRDLGINVIWVGQSKSRLLRLLKIFIEVRRLKPDILQSSHFHTNLYVALLGFFNFIPSIGAVRNDCFSEIQDVGQFLGQLSLKMPRIIAGNSMAGIRNALSLGVNKHRLLFLPNVVDTSQFSVASQTFHHPLVLVTVGRLVDQKKINRFISIVAQLREQSNSSVKGLIVGDGPLRDSLRQQAKDLGLNEDVLEFRGLSANMPQVYKESDVFVLTSDWEGTPNVVLEAMASGLPVVSTNVGGVSDIIKHGKSGFIVEATNKDQMLDIILQLIESPKLREIIAQEARIEIENSFALHLLSSYLKTLYESVIKIKP